MIDQPRRRLADMAYGRHLLVPSFLLALGIGSVLMLLANNWIHGVLILGRLDVMRTVGDIRTQSAIVHIWIEELVTGDIIDRPGIEGTLQDSGRLLMSITEAEASKSWLDRFLSDDDNGEVQDGIARASFYLERFADLSRERQRGYDRGGDVGIGSEIDVTYDAIFENLQLELDELWAAMERRLDKASSLEQILSRSIAIAWIAIVALALSAIWSHERRRREAETALRRSEAQLIQAQKMEALGRLAGGIAHDINNHLAAIAMQCEAIKLKPSDPAEMGTRIEAIINTAGKSATMIKRLLAFSRKQPVQPKIINANDVVTDLEDILAGLISENIRLETHLAADLSTVSMDSSQLEQVILNLVVNACEAMPSGGDLVIETGDVVDKGEKRVCLLVRDSGVGVPDDLQKRIFEPFFTTKDMVRNSGLGLATVDGIARQNGGEIRMESRQGRGTTFRLLLPVSDRPADRPASSDEATAGARPTAGGNTVLLVEDNDDLRTSTTAVLRSLGYQVHAADNAETALDRFDDLAAEIDLALVDVIMPGMDGKELADELRRRRPALKVLFMSGYTDDRLSEHDIAGDDVDLLTKPFTVKDLAAKIDAALAERPMTSRVA